MPNFTLYCLLCSIVLISVIAFESKLGEVKIINFVKLQTENKSFNFNYLTSNGSSFNGETIPVVTDKIHFLVDGEGGVYWVDLREEITNSSTMFTKPAISVNRTSDHSFTFQDNDYVYEVFVDEGSGKIRTKYNNYRTKFDLNNICFTKLDDGTQRFKFEIGALNNDKKLSGTAEMKNEQTLVIDKKSGCRALTVNFTDQELATKETFCKGYVDCVPTPSPQAAIEGTDQQELHPRVAISLVG